MPVDYILWLFLFLIPINAHIVAVEHDELIAAILISKPPAQMLFFLERFNLWRLVLFVHAALAAIAVDIGESVDEHGVLLVERGSI